MSGAFITVLRESGFWPLMDLAKSRYRCLCGLSIGVSVDKLDSGATILSSPDLLKSAHRRHHDKHFGTPATLYMIGGLTGTGIETLAAAQCSCDYDKEHPRD